MPNFDALAEHLNSLHERKVPGCSVTVYQDGKKVFGYSAGYADEKCTRDFSTDTPVFLFSCTKPITATAAMQFVENGKIGLDDQVCRYLPEYADAYITENGSKVVVGDKMTIRNLFTMSAGLSYDLHSEPIRELQKSDRYEKAGTREVVSVFPKAPLWFTPGERFNYSLCHDVLAAVVETVSGMKYGEYLKKNIFEPLEMNDTGFKMSSEQYNRASDLFSVNDEKDLVLCDKEIGEFLITPEYESGGAGLFSTAEDLGRFAAAMSMGGCSADGRRILNEQSIKLMTTPQYRYDRGFTYGLPGYCYGLGVRVLESKSQGQRSSVGGEFGWDGAAGSFVLMDVISHTGIVYTQNVRGWPSLWLGMHIPVRDLSYDALFPDKKDNCLK